jgi:Lon protease-like protein
MEKIIPLFPLSLVVYPYEDLNLHIFEPRYKQLVQDSADKKDTFGIPTYMNNRVGDYGTEVEITKIDKIYPDGRMDIKTRGRQAFKILTFDNPLRDRLYAGGLVEILENDYTVDEAITFRLVQRITELYDVLQIHQDLDMSQARSFSFLIAHRIGLSLEQEYELLAITSETERQRYMLEHLEKAIPIVQEIERTKHIIRMNGHFKNFDPLNF